MVKNDYLIKVEKAQAKHLNNQDVVRLDHDDTCIYVEFEGEYPMRGEFWKDTGWEYEEVPFVGY